MWRARFSPHKCPTPAGPKNDTTCQAIRGPSKLADHMSMVREVAAISPFQSARLVEQPTSRTIRLPLPPAADDRSHTIRLKAFSPLILRQKAAKRRNGRKQRSKMVQMVRELGPCKFDAYAMISG